MSKTEQDNSPNRNVGSGRRSFLGTLLAAAAGVAALAAGALGARKAKRQRERDLHEADLYSPHDLAG